MMWARNKGVFDLQAVYDEAKAAHDVGTMQWALAKIDDLRDKLQRWNLAPWHDKLFPESRSSYLWLCVSGWVREKCRVGNVE